MADNIESNKIGSAANVPLAATRKFGPLKIGCICLFEPVDLAIWVFVLLFFMGSALISGGDLPSTFMGAAAIVVIMFFVGVTVETIIETLRDVKGLGTIVGFITNGPEALCLIVGLLAGDILFAASTPLGSNIMNPLMLISAALITGMLMKTVRTNPGYTVICILITAAFAVSFFFIPESYRLVWFICALIVSMILFRLRPPEEAEDDDGGDTLSRFWFIPALVILVLAGYLLDPIVSFTAEHSNAPKGVIGFFVLSALTSWPEFKSCLSLYRRNRPLAAILNITVSNITNIWLALLGIAIYMMAL